MDKPNNVPCFSVKGRQLLLVETQVSRSYNILIRLLLYFADTHLGIIKEYEDWDVHDTAGLPLPVPEFYVIYTGERKSVPTVIRIIKDFPRSNTIPFDLEARVISIESTDDII